MAIDAGKLNKRVTFLVQDGECGAEKPLVEGVTRWASVDFVSGNNRYGADSFIAQATHKVTMRYLKGVQPNWQVRCGDTVFQIVYLDDVQQQHVQLDLYCIVLNGVS